MQRQDHQHQQKMGCSGAAEPGSGGGAGGGAGGGGGSGGVLARFLSAPATWLDALLLELDEPQQQQQHQQQQTSPPAGASARPPAAPKAKTQTPPELPPLRRSNSISDPTSFLDSAFSRHNSCPPEFLARLASNDLFSASDFEASSIPDAPSSHKRPRESEPSQNPSSQSSAAVSDVELDSLFQDSVPCRVRAKRGCATHPRSIAERVRRTRISDRIRKLQEVVPNMDKQTNTADMLEEAVEYVKTLQKQVQAEFYDISHPQTWQDLVEHRKKCKCVGTE